MVLFQAFGQDKLHSKKKKAIADYKEGNEMLILNLVNEAQRLFESAINRDKSFDEAILALIQVYIRKGELSNARNAISNSEKYLESEFLNRANYDLAKSYWMRGEYHEASEVFQLVNGSALDIKDSDIEFLKENIAFALKEYESLNSIEREELKLELNQFTMQYFPSIDASGQLVFTARDKKWKGHEQIMVSSFVSENWTTPVSISDNINSELNEGTASISANGQKLVFTGCNRPNGFGSCDLYFSEKLNGEWTQPVLLPKEINSRFWDSQPSLSTNGDKLYFVSARPGLGGQDIWVSQLVNNEWTQAVNLGESVNTTKDDASPFIYPDDQTLFFASNGRPGMGKFDLYSSKINAGQWSQAINLGGAINNELDQVGYSISTDGWAYYSSTQPDGRILLERFRMPEEIIPQIQFYNFEILAIDSVTSELLLARISNSSNLVKFVSQSTGKYQAIFKERTMSVLIESEGYESKNLVIRRGHNEVKMRPKIIVPESINILFKTNEYFLSKNQQMSLQPYMQFVRKNSNYYLKIDSYTDSQGSTQINQSLSQKRLQSVIDFFMNRGIAKNQIKGYSKGDQPAIDSLGNDVSSEQYRKVEIRLIKR